MKLQVRIVETREVADQVRAFVLCAMDGSALPPWTPGAHIQVLLPLAGGVTSRAYSLTGDPADRYRYRIAVQREAAGAGGSRYLHDDTGRGARLVISSPASAFSLVPTQRPVELVAGGIGLTPLLSMARQLLAWHSDFRCTVFSRAEGAIPYLGELRSVIGQRLAVVAGSDLPASRQAMARIAARAAEHDADVYFCGPDGFTRALGQACSSRGIAPGRLHSERFVNPAQFDAGRGFTIRIASTGETCAVPPGVSALDALARTLGFELPYDCRAGYCGTCIQAVADGIPEHRDTCLSFEEKASDAAMCLCVSRAKTPEITLHL